MNNPKVYNKMGMNGWASRNATYESNLS